MWYLSKQRCTVWEVEDKGNYALVKLSTSRKDKRTGEYVNSNWSFVRFVGKAYEGIVGVAPKTRIVVDGGISHEPYMKDGVRTWAKNPSTVVFAWEYPEAKASSSSGMDEPPTVEDSDEPLPF